MNEPIRAPTSAPMSPTTPPLPRIAILGRLGTPQLACLRSWRRHGVRCVFLHADETPLSPLVARLLGVRCVDLGPLRLDDAGFVARLAQALQHEAVQALTCVSEPISVALWACRDRLPSQVEIVSVRPQAVERLQSKVEQDRLARAAGLATLPTWSFAPGALVKVPAEAFPLVLRPDIARSVKPAFKVEVVADAGELQRAVDRLAPESSGVIAQPFRRGPNLLVHAFRSADGRLSGHVAFRVEVKHEGLSVMMRPVPLDPHIAAGCARLEAELGLSGVFHYDFIVDARDGAAYFLDLNPRLGGTTGKALAAGYDEPLALLATLVPEALPRNRFIGDALAPSGGKHQALRAIVSALRGRSSSADYPYPDRGRLLRALGGYLVRGRDEILRADALRSVLAFGLYQTAKRGAAR